VAAAEVAWFHPALAAVVRGDRLAEFDATVGADPSGRSITMGRAVAQLIAAGRLSEDQLRSLRAEHPAATGTLAGMLFSSAGTGRAAARTEHPAAAALARVPARAGTRRGLRSPFRKSKFPTAPPGSTQLAAPLSAGPTSAPTRRGTATTTPVAPSRVPTHVGAAAYSARTGGMLAPGARDDAASKRARSRSRRPPTQPPTSGSGLTITRQG
jgi:hypothetical protein